MAVQDDILLTEQLYSSCIVQQPKGVKWQIEIPSGFAENMGCCNV